MGLTLTAQESAELRAAAWAYKNRLTKKQLQHEMRQFLPDRKVSGRHVRGLMKYPAARASLARVILNTRKDKTKVYYDFNELATRGALKWAGLLLGWAEKLQGYGIGGIAVDEATGVDKTVLHLDYAVIEARVMANWVAEGTGEKKD